MGGRTVTVTFTEEQANITLEAVAGYLRLMFELDQFKPKTGVLNDAKVALVDALFDSVTDPAGKS